MTEANILETEQDEFDKRFKKYAAFLGNTEEEYLQIKILYYSKKLAELKKQLEKIHSFA